jgi:hypothetical protein
MKKKRIKFLPFKKKKGTVCGLNLVRVAMVIKNNGSYQDLLDAFRG